MSINEFGYKQELQRSLSLTDLIIYGMIFMIPIAPFGIYGWVSDASGGMVPTAYLIGMIAMLFTALSYQALAKKFPIAGSVYSYASRGINQYFGFIAGWVLLLDYLLIPPLLYIFSAISLTEIFPFIPKLAWLVVFLVGALLANLVGISFTAKVNKVFLVAEVIVLAIFITAGLYALYGNDVGAGELTAEPFFNAATFQPSLVLQAVSIAVLSFLGFDAISTLAEEVKEKPEKKVGQAALITLFLMGFLFILQTWIAADLAKGMTFKSADTAFYEIATKAGGQWLATLAAVATALAWGIAVSIASQAAVSRLLYSMARDKKLPAVLANVHPKFKTPHISIYLVSILSLFVGYFFLDAPDTLASLVNFGALTSFVILHMTVIYHFFIKNKSTAIIKHLVCPLIGFMIIATVLYNMDVHAQVLGLIWMACGFIYMLFLKIVRKGDIAINMG
ncbi:APC family permease [Marinomonas pollencensis]|uniref:Amino acid/polyamine/organocation transporter (APC superfamily) n=1 Tax=Marinomonas pollencensis TaxID=491954 RepID=A0A3E0DMZ8_9GAMM|nr:APC family permease [Marinomonas pollencensis]REG83181.1 amino acid/polyamine/organocation transporter (APC superfamily) [Marinomonas pollencensis]